MGTEIMGRRVTGHQSRIQALIGDELLIEILSRIPTPIQAIRCKLVCKGWCSLISSPRFIRRFKQQHIKHESMYPKPLLGMLSNTVDRVNLTDPENNPDEFNFRGFNLDYIPAKNGNIMVLAACNDLIICRAETYNHYLCNPFTMQWVALPPPTLPPTQPSWQSHIVKTGLVCETYKGLFRYRVVCFYLGHDCDHGRRRYQVEMYCSEISQWIQCDDLGTGYWFGSKIGAHNGKLHWVNQGGEYFVTYDPFNRRQTSVRLSNGPTLGIRDLDMGSLLNSVYYHVGECEGVLRVMKLERINLDDGGPVRTMTFKDVNVWELQEDDQDTRRLILKDRIIFNVAVSDDPNLDNIREVGFHPRNKEVIFLVVNDFLTSFNTKTRKLRVETRYSCLYKYAFTVQLPWWPTSIVNPPQWIPSVVRLNQIHSEEVRLNQINLEVRLNHISDGSSSGEGNGSSPGDGGLPPRGWINKWTVVGPLLISFIFLSFRNRSSSSVETS